MKIKNVTNAIQRRYNELCDKPKGPTIEEVRKLIFSGSEKLNDLGQQEIDKALEVFLDRDPWKVCFAVGLSWGHLAKFDLTFIDSATNCLEKLNDPDLNVAASFHLERGPAPIIQSLQGGYTLFQNTKLPKELPNSIEKFRNAQQRILAIVLMPQRRPKYIGAWNATALFLTALFHRRELWKELTNIEILLPPNGPVGIALEALYKAKIISASPYASDLDDGGWEPGVLAENNGLMAELLDTSVDLNMIDIHSGLYMLGTGYKASSQWEPDIIPV